MEQIPWQEISVGVAAVLGLVYVAKTMRRVVRDTLEFLGNHLSGVTSAQSNTVAALEKVADRLERVEERVAEHASLDHVGSGVRRDRTRRPSITIG
jgi:hypothetical protein